ncbi:unnamed protein product [Sphenostylis stenocarpa]|uniref:Arp2/3 complex 34 kDa subunit n=1 Tax=Sphenostylis stenocarpa TaxID=92480 RepID=A0AA86S4T2_9FABA|nr:unnamed protein product [Sphenostylis stenocarpa]
MEFCVLRLSVEMPLIVQAHHEAVMVVENDIEEVMGRLACGFICEEEGNGRSLESRRPKSLEKGVELDHHWVEFDDVRYHIQVSMKNPHVLLLSVSLPTPSSETIFVNGLPFGAIEAIKASYGNLVQILDPPRDGFNLTLKINLSKLPANQEQKYAFLVKVASIREVVLGAPLRVILEHLAARTVAPDLDPPVALVHRPNESFFLFPQNSRVQLGLQLARVKFHAICPLSLSIVELVQRLGYIMFQDLSADKVIVVYPMRFNDSIDIVLATSFLQEFVEARRTAGLHNTPPCSWSLTPPLEIKGVPSDALSANAGFVTFGQKLDRTVWNLSTFHAYVSYHVKCSEGFMHTRMRRRVESLIQVESLSTFALDRAKPDAENSTKTSFNRSFKRLMLVTRSCDSPSELFTPSIQGLAGLFLQTAPGASESAICLEAIETMKSAPEACSGLMSYHAITSYLERLLDNNRE